MYEVDEVEAVRELGIQQVTLVESHGVCLVPGPPLWADISGLVSRRRVGLVNTSQLRNKYY